MAPNSPGPVSNTPGRRSSGRAWVWPAALALVLVGLLAYTLEAAAQEDVLPADALGQVPFWLVLGTFPNTEGCTPSLPPLIDELNAAPQPGLCEAGRDWSTYVGTTSACATAVPGPCSPVGVDLNCFFSDEMRAHGAPDNVRAYTFVYVHSPDERPAQIRASSDDGSLIFFNGELVADKRTECHCYGHPDAPGHAHDVTLQAGRNRLLVSVGEAAGHWGYDLKFTHPDGTPMNDLTFSLGEPIGDHDGDGVNDSCDADSDDDNVVDTEDACLFTTLGDVVDAEGCSISQYCPCAGADSTPWQNHGAYTSCVAQTSAEFMKHGLISDAEKGSVVSEAARSACGKP